MSIEVGALIVSCEKTNLVANLCRKQGCLRPPPPRQLPDGRPKSSNITSFDFHTFFGHYYHHDHDGKVKSSEHADSLQLIWLDETTQLLVQREVDDVEDATNTNNSNLTNDQTSSGSNSSSSNSRSKRMWKAVHVLTHQVPGGAAAAGAVAFVRGLRVLHPSCHPDRNGRTKDIISFAFPPTPPPAVLAHNTHSNNRTESVVNAASTVATADGCSSSSHGREPVSRFTFIELFCGIGGFRVALEPLGGRCVFASELGVETRMGYAANFDFKLNNRNNNNKEKMHSRKKKRGRGRNAAGEKEEDEEEEEEGESKGSSSSSSCCPWLPCGDITEIPTEGIPQHDLLTAGFPCQSFCKAGSGAGLSDRTRGGLFYEIIRILRPTEPRQQQKQQQQRQQPRAFLLENVAHLLELDGGETMKIIVRELEACGYDVSYRVLDAADYGVPQHRQRLYITGILKDNEDHRQDDSCDRVKAKVFDISQVCLDAYRQPHIPLSRVLEQGQEERDEQTEGGATTFAESSGKNSTTNRPTKPPSSSSKNSSLNSNTNFTLNVQQQHRLTPSQWRAVCTSSTFTKTNGASRIADVSKPARTLISSYRSHHIMYSVYVPLRYYEHDSYVDVGDDANHQHVITEGKNENAQQHATAASSDTGGAGATSKVMKITTETNYQEALARVRVSAAQFTIETETPTINKGDEIVKVINRAKTKAPDDGNTSKPTPPPCISPSSPSSLPLPPVLPVPVPVRFYTLQECKRIMGFPEDFVVELPSGHLGAWQRQAVPPSTGYHMLGNAVVPPVIRMIVSTMLEAGVLAGSDGRRS